MKTKIFALLAVLVMFAGVMTSCDKNDYEPMAPVISNDDVSSSVRGELRSLSDFATGAYSIDQIYKNEYSHIYQYDNSATSTYPNGWPGGTTGPGNCSWSNYIMAVGCVGRASGTIDSDDYKLDKARRLKEFMKNSRGSYLRGAVMQYIYKKIMDWFMIILIGLVFVIGQLVNQEGIMRLLLKSFWSILEISKLRLWWLEQLLVDMDIISL